MSIEAKGISFSYNSVSVLEGVNFEIEQGDFVAILGPNGSGKTTLLKILLGILKQKKGIVKLFGQDTNSFSNWNLIGYVPQRYEIDGIFPGNVSEILDLRNSPEKNDIIQSFGLEELLGKKMNELSGGQQQKVFLAFSMLSNPKILILDEPTVGVDIKSQNSFYSMLKELNKKRNITIILVTHEVAIIPKIARTIICIKAGTCYKCNATHSMEEIQKLYGKEMEIHVHEHV